MSQSQIVIEVPKGPLRHPSNAKLLAGLAKNFSTTLATVSRVSVNCVKKARKLNKDMKENKQKRAPTSYMLFSKKIRPQVLKENPEATGVEDSSKLIAKRWKELSDEEKKPYQDEHERLKALLNNSNDQEDDNDDDDDEDDEDDDESVVEKPKKKKSKKSKKSKKGKKRKRAPAPVSDDEEDEVASKRSRHSDDEENETEEE